MSDPANDRLKNARRIALALVVCFIGAITFVRLGVVLPWVLGPLVFMTVASVFGAPVSAPAGGQQVGQMMIGAALGLFFTQAVLLQMLNLGPTIAVAALCAAAVGCFVALVFRRMANVDFHTAFFASMPGGPAEMATLADRTGGRADWVVAAQALRMVFVVLTIPAAVTLSGVHGADAWQPLSIPVCPLGLVLLLTIAVTAGVTLNRLRVPNGWFLGPLAALATLTACGVELSALPVWLVNGSQLLIGCAFGSRFDAQFIRTGPRLLLAATVCVVLSVILSVLYALGLAWFTDTHWATVVLATAPGGVAEMSITAQQLGLGVPIVVAFHVCRTAVLVSAAGLLHKLMLTAHRWQQRRRGSPE